jgi:hypothetical protein
MPIRNPIRRSPPPLWRSWIITCLVSLLVPLGLALTVPQAAHAATCPNEVLRSQLSSMQLPNCRAYELVSPASKNGWSVRLRHANHANGQRMIVGTLGSFGGGDQVTLENIFDIERTFQGWSTSPLVEPPGLVTTSFNPVAESSDLTRGLFEERPAAPLSSAERGFYTQTLPNGSPAEVGPAFSRAALEAAPFNEDGFISGSPNVSGEHVLFGIEGPGLNGVTDLLWPGDSTVGNGDLLGFWSLYEYSGVGNSEPKLVGVSNAGPLRDDREARLISQCGTSLGFPLEGAFSDDSSDLLEEAYNAISTAGETSRVFFTASATAGKNGDTCNEAGEGRGPRVDELYTRINASETVAISEPAPESCLTCNTSEAAQKAAPGGAVFQGASEDGSKVFFLSAQQLLPNAQGANLYEFNFDASKGERVSLVAPEAQGVSRISENGSHVYFVAHGYLTKGPRGGGCLAELSAAEKTEEATAEEEEGKGLVPQHPSRCRPTPGADNLYVRNTDTGQTSFIGSLCSDAGTSGEAADRDCPNDLNSEPPAKGGLNDLADWQQEDVRPVDATPDGRFLVFTSTADLLPSDTSTVAQVFEYDAETESLVRVSIGQNSFNDNGNVTARADGARIAFPTYANSQNPAPQLTSVSDNGSIVVFQSADPLVPGVLEGSTNVYEYKDGRIYLISDGQDRSVDEQGNPSTSLLGMDGSGQDLFFTTADQLIALDGDTQENIYDARAEGGFPPPSARATCEGDGCQGALTQMPFFPLPDSANQPAEQGSSPSSTSVAVSKPRTLTKAQKLAKALSACRKQHNKHKRVACETKARKLYGAKQAKKASAKGEGSKK